MMMKGDEMAEILKGLSDLLIAVYDLRSEKGVVVDGVDLDVLYDKLAEVYDSIDPELIER
jgi:hypothetical protein